MNKKKGIKLALSCFMIISIIAMGFTGFKVQEVNAKSVDIYSSINAKEISNEILKEEQKEEQNFIETLESKVDIELTGYTLSVGNKKIATLQNPSEISEILDNIKAPFSGSDDESVQRVNTQILEELNVSKEEVYLKDINKKEEVLDYIKTGGEEVKVHTVEIGESLSTIGQIYKISTEELEKINPDKDGNNLRAGDQVTVKATKPLMTVVTKEEVESTVKTDYKIEVKEDPNMYKTKSKIQVEGIAGEIKITTEQIKQNGRLIKKEIINEEILKEPINQIVVKGTKEVPKTIATGAFLMPTRGRISSPFGPRWGRMHRGIDIAKEHGSDIQAADGGTVSHSGAKGTYGNMIEIDHGNGYKTRYAHCSKLLFSPGQKVSKGQVIAKIGSTGRSTGPHLHFEVIKNGVHQNPSNYVN